MQQPQQVEGQFLITISNKENEVIKFINPQHQIKCQKIINLHLDKDKQLINLYRLQIDRIKDFLKRRYELTSLLSTHPYLHITQHSPSKEHIYFKINTNYCQYPNLEDYLKKESLHPETQMARDGKTLTFFIQQFLQIILRAGGIDFFFYTPRNIFIISSKNEWHDLKYNRLLLNFSSMAGIKLICSKGIYRQDLWEIFGLIPPDFYQLIKKQENMMKLNNVIKKRALGFLIICFIIKRVVNLIDITKLSVIVQPSRINALLEEESVKVFQKIISIYQKAFLQATKQTGIDFIELIRQIFIVPYTQENSSTLITWHQIYTLLYPKHSLNTPDIASSNKYFNQMMSNVWKRQKNQQFFKEREWGMYSVQTNRIIYFLTRFNCNFHKVIKYPNPCMLILNEHFSQDVNQVIVRLLRLLQDQQIEEQTKQQDCIEKGEPKAEDEDKDLHYNCFNPFALKSPKQVQIIKKCVGGDSNYVNGVADAVQFTRSAYSFQYYDKQSNKVLTSVSHKQVMLSEFCDALWKL